MSDALTITFGSLHAGPVERSWRIVDPEKHLGELPGRLDPVDIELTVRGDVRDGVRATGRIASRAACSCRRCLSDVAVDIEADIDVWFRAADEVTPGEDGVWPFSGKAAEVDLAPAIREEILLAIPDFPVCETACQGLCPGCGARLADETCTCPPPEPDPRWAALLGESAANDDVDSDASEA
jgi:uncharacterized protein